MVVLYSDEVAEVLDRWALLEWELPFLLYSIHTYWLSPVCDHDIVLSRSSLFFVRPPVMLLLPSFRFRYLNEHYFLHWILIDYLEASTLLR